MLRWIFLLCFTSLLAFNASAAQAGKGKNKKNKGDKEWPVTFVIEHEKELKITSDQMVRLDGLQDIEEKVVADPAVKGFTQKLKAARKSGDEKEVKELQDHLAAKIKEQTGGKVTTFVAGLKLILDADQMAKFYELRKPNAKDGKEPVPGEKDAPPGMKNPFDF